MRCPHCAFENREGVRFCEECGRGLRRPALRAARVGAVTRGEAALAPIDPSPT